MYHVLQHQQFSIDPRNFSANYLPPALADTIRQIARSVGVPEFQVVAQALPVISTAAMRCRKVQVDGRSPLPIGLAVLVVASSGGGKTSVADLLSRPLRAWAAEHDEAASQLAENEAAQRLLIGAEEVALSRRIRDSILDDRKAATKDAEHLLSLRKLRSTDPAPGAFDFEVRTGTMAGLRATLRATGSVAFWNAPDGMAALESPLAGEASALSDMWSGDGPIHRTQVRGRERFKDVKFAALVAVQPQAWAEWAATPRGQRWVKIGLLGRFLVTGDLSQPNGQVQASATHELADLQPFAVRLQALLEQGNALAQAGSPLPSLQLSADAQALLRQHQSHWISAQQGDLPPALCAALARAAENALRIAACLTLFEHPEATTIEATNMSNACELVRLFLDGLYDLAGPDAQRRIVEDAMLSVLRVLNRAGGPVLLSMLPDLGSRAQRDRKILKIALELGMSQGLFSIQTRQPRSVKEVWLTPFGWQSLQAMLPAWELHTSWPPLLQRAFPPQPIVVQGFTPERGA